MNERSRPGPGGVEVGAVCLRHTRKGSSAGAAEGGRADLLADHGGTEAVFRGDEVVLAVFTDVESDPVDGAGEAAGFWCVVLADG